MFISWGLTLFLKIRSTLLFRMVFKAFRELLARHGMAINPLQDSRGTSVQPL